jgi:pimeloyl-ACP methyl ester carboxylesterase
LHREQLIYCTRQSADNSIDLVLAYDDKGSGEPLVLIHGHPFNRSMWRPQIERFRAAGWRVIAPDLRGYGATGVTGASRMVTLDVFALDIAALLDNLGVDRFVLGGLSMGGQIVMEFYRLFPRRVRGLLLADTSPVADTEDGRKRRRETAGRLMREGMRPYAEEVLSTMVAAYNVEAQPAVARHVLEMMCGTAPEGAAAALRGRAERRDYVTMLADISVPALVVVGRDDEFTPVGDARLMAERIPAATLAVIDGAGHLPNLERPEAFNDALGSFLASLPDSPADSRAD